MQQTDYLACGICMRGSGLLMSAFLWHTPSGGKLAGVDMLIHSTPMCEECMAEAVVMHADKNSKRAFVAAAGNGGVAQVQFAVPPAAANLLPEKFDGGIVA